MQKLYIAKHPVRFILFEGGDHGIREHRVEMFNEMRMFLDKYVRDNQRFPSLEPHGK